LFVPLPVIMPLLWLYWLSGSLVVAVVFFGGNVIDGAYFTAGSIATVGFGDVMPQVGAIKRVTGTAQVFKYYYGNL
jgi:hypothetical protein